MVNCTNTVSESSGNRFVRFCNDPVVKKEIMSTTPSVLSPRKYDELVSSVWNNKTEEQKQHWNAETGDDLLQGCGWKGEYGLNGSNLQMHLDTLCPISLVACGLDGCQTRAPRYQIEQHRSICLHRLVACALCNKQYKSLQLDAHLEVCPERLISCPSGCDIAPFPLCEVAQHKSVCSQAIVACPYHFRGCRNQMLRFEESNHLASCEFAGFSCLLCKEPYLDYNEHEQSCQERVLICPKQCLNNQGEQYWCKRKELNHHLEQQCPRVLVCCAILGCEEQVERRSLKEHDHLASLKHVKLLQDHIETLNVTIQTLKDKATNSHPTHNVISKNNAVRDPSRFRIGEMEHSSDHLFWSTPRFLEP